MRCGYGYHVRVEDISQSMTGSLGMISWRDFFISLLPSRPRTPAGRLVTLGMLVLVAGCLPHPEPDLRNAVLIVVDTLRADHLGAYGYFRDTSPAIDALAEESLLFERCLSPVGETLPAHTSLFTGVYPLEHGILGNVNRGGKQFVSRPGVQLFAQFARERGLRTAAFVSSTPVKRQSGIAAGFETFDEPGLRQRSAARTNAMAFPWLEAMGDAPFFVWIHYFDPHYPYESYELAEGFDRYRSDEALEQHIRQRVISASATRPNQNVQETREAINGYDDEIRYVDSEISRLIEHLKALGLWQDLLVILVSDHGEGLGEHEMLGHGYIHHEQLHVPLLMRIPGRAPQRIATPISLVDVLPTALSQPNTIEGDWSEFLAQASGRDVLSAGAIPESLFSQQSARPRPDHPGRAYALTSQRWKYVHEPGGDDRLFDLSKDPFELSPLAIAGEPQSVRLKAELLDRIEAQQERGRMLGEIDESRAEEIDQQTLDELRELGYVD